MNINPNCSLNKNLHLSLVIATRDNVIKLSEFLDKLLLCEKPNSWEIILADNGSTDNTKESVQKYQGILPIKYIYVEQQGKSRALNQALKYVTGEIILFSDDDIIPDKMWLISHIRNMSENNDVSVIGGRIIVDNTMLPLWLANSYNLKGILVSEHEPAKIKSTYSQGQFPFGPNLSVRKKLLENIKDPWPENIGPGTDMPVGDETIFITKISKITDERIYCPDCIVEHKPVIKDNILYDFVHRSFMGGFVAGFYLLRGDEKSTSNSIGKLAAYRISSCRSIKEFICIVSRAIGFYSGYMLKYFRKQLSH